MKLTTVTRVLCLLTVLVPTVSVTIALAPAQAATCYGDTPCNACKTCRYCKHCAKEGGTCGVCKAASARRARQTRSYKLPVSRRGKTIPRWGVGQKGE